MTQRTLLQFSFSSRPKDNTFLSGPDTVEDDGRQGGSDNSVEPVAVAMPPKLAVVERKETNECLSNSVTFWQTYPEICAADSYENINREFATNCEEVNAVTPKCLLEARMPAFNTSITEISIIMKTLETYIVGHKFCGEVDVAQGDSISLSREPENLKDPNAIKVQLQNLNSS